jgi:cell division protein ZapE
MNMNLLDDYTQAIDAGTIHDDAHQRDVMRHLQRLLDELARPPLSWYHRLLSFKKSRQTRVKGVYLYGPVGGGKTFLVDLFYQRLATINKARFHFHHFMQQIDAKLRAHQGQSDPLRRIAADIAQSTRLLCLDEFLVHDVADAMILAELLEALFSHDIVLVVAANTAPDDLYLNGVQRQRFLPAIDLLKLYCEIVMLDDARDYRLGRGCALQSYWTPVDEAANLAMSEQFSHIATTIEEDVDLMVQNRLIRCMKLSPSAVWFSFDVICSVPRCALDYLEIASRFDTVFVSSIPALGADDTTHVILLIHLVDVLYDRGIRLVLSAALPATHLYEQGPMRSAFLRTQSRLEEMQSLDYLQRHAHRDVGYLE